MNFQSLRANFLSLLHPSAANRVDLRIETQGSYADTEQVFIVIDKEFFPLGTVPQATECVGYVLQSQAPEYWINAFKTLKDYSGGIEKATWETDPDFMKARTAAALGWVDRRVGNRSVAKAMELGADVGFMVERKLKAIRNGLPAPLSAKVYNETAASLSASLPSSIKAAH